MKKLFFSLFTVAVSLIACTPKASPAVTEATITFRNYCQQ